MSEALQPSHGRFERRIWRPERDYGVGRRHRKPQTIDCFVPDRIAGWDPSLTAATAAALAEADAAARDLNDDVPRLASLEALSRQLLRQEAIGSSRIEGLVMGQRRLARAAAGVGGDDTARQIVGNVRGWRLHCAGLAASVGSCRKSENSSGNAMSLLITSRSSAGHRSFSAYRGFRPRICAIPTPN